MRVLFYGSFYKASEHLKVYYNRRGVRQQILCCHILRMVGVVVRRFCERFVLCYKLFSAGLHIPHSSSVD